jgi:uncharacterized phiE125 gp8 family phage protein
MSFIQAPFWARHRASRQPLHGKSVVITEPSLRPISLSEVKNAARVSGSADDAYLSGLIIAATKQVEKDLGDACLVATVVEHWIDRAPDTAALVIPRWPLQSVASVKSYDQDDAETTLSATDYLVDTVSRPGRVILNYDASWPTSLRPYKSIVVRHTSGFSGTSKSVTSITRAGTLATVTLPVAHGWASGKRVTHAGVDQADYNGTFEITVTGAATYTFVVSGSPTTPATGVMTTTDLGIPELYTLAVMTLVTHWYELRGMVSIGASADELPMSYTSLISDAPLVLA